MDLDKVIDMVYWKQIGLNEVKGGNIKADNIKELLDELVVGEDVKVEWSIYYNGNFMHPNWKYTIICESVIWLKCVSHNIFNKIFDDVMSYDSKNKLR